MTLEGRRELRAMGWRFGGAIIALAALAVIGYLVTHEAAKDEPSAPHKKGEAVRQSGGGDALQPANAGQPSAPAPAGGKGGQHTGGGQGKPDSHNPNGQGPSGGGGESPSTPPQTAPGPSGPPGPPGSAGPPGQGASNAAPAPEPPGLIDPALGKVCEATKPLNLCNR